MAAVLSARLADCQMIDMKAEKEGHAGYLLLVIKKR